MKTYINGHCIEQVLTNAVELTTAQYNALPAAQKSSGTYIITDAEAPSIEASNVSYDMGGGITSDVQTVLDDLISNNSLTQIWIPNIGNVNKGIRVTFTDNDAFAFVTLSGAIGDYCLYYLANNTYNTIMESDFYIVKEDTKSFKITTSGGWVRGFILAYNPNNTITYEVVAS